MLDLEYWVRVKAQLLANGVKVSSQHDIGSNLIPFYSVVTSGLELVLPNSIHVNTLLNEDSPNTLFLDDSRSFIDCAGERIAVEILPPVPALNQKLNETDSMVSDFASVSTDRINVWAVENCVYGNEKAACQFCDVAYDVIRYRTNPIDQIKESLGLLTNQSTDRIQHIQVSGGTPRGQDWNHYIEVCQAAVDTGLRTSVMISLSAPDWVFDELKKIGVYELSLNIEFYSERARELFTPGKRVADTWGSLSKVAEKWELGRVRSALIVGLESPEDTILGAQELLRRKIIPVFSPFRSAKGTALEGKYQVKSEDLERLYLSVAEFADSQGLWVGPSCGACQNNVMALPIS